MMQDDLKKRISLRSYDSRNLLKKHFSTLENPTVQDAVNFYKENIIGQDHSSATYLKPPRDLEYLVVDYIDDHDSLHIRSGNMFRPPNELSQTVFDLGFQIYFRNSSQSIEIIKRKIDGVFRDERVHYSNGESIPDNRKTISNQTLTVNFALGAYYRMFLEEFSLANMKNNYNYEDQLRLISNMKQSETEYAEQAYNKNIFSGRKYMKMPSEVIFIGDFEKRQVFSIALGKSKACDTQFPNRLKIVEKMVSDLNPDKYLSGMIHSR